MKVPCGLNIPLHQRDRDRDVQSPTRYPIQTNHIAGITPQIPRPGATFSRIDLPPPWPEKGEQTNKACR